MLVWIGAVEAEHRCTVGVYEAPVRLAKRHTGLGYWCEADGTAVAQNEHSITRATFVNSRQTEVPDVVVVGHGC